MAQLPPEQLVSIAFPVHGIDLNQGFGQQTPQSTRVGQNVRVVEPDSERARGGSRPGLAKYLTDQLPNGAHLIQHLAVVINPGGEGLLANYDDEDWVWYDPSDNPPQSNPADPTDLRVRNRNRQLPEGGTGIQQSVRLLSNKVTPEIIWDLVGGIWSGEALSAVQLMATAVDPETRLTVDGTFTYNPTFGVLLSAGAHNLRVKFTPEDTNYYRNAYGREAILVSKRTPTINWSTPSDITTGTALSGTQLNATAVDPVTSASVAGTLTYAQPSGTILPSGVHQALAVTFTPTNTDQYETNTKTVYLNVGVIQFVQGKVDQYPAGAATTGFSFAMNSSVTAGNFLVLLMTVEHDYSFANYPASDPATAITVSDSLGNTWVNAGEISGDIDPIFDDFPASQSNWWIKLSLWYAKNISGGDCTITVGLSPATFSDDSYAVAEYSGVHAISPFRALSSGAVLGGNHSAALSDYTINTGSISASAGDLIVASRSIGNGGSFTSSNTNFTLRLQENQVSLSDNISAAGSESATWTTSTPEGCLAIGASFKLA